MANDEIEQKVHQMPHRPPRSGTDKHVGAGEEISEESELVSPEKVPMPVVVQVPKNSIRRVLFEHYGPTLVLLFFSVAVLYLAKKTIYDYSIFDQAELNYKLKQYDRDLGKLDTIFSQIKHVRAEYNELFPNPDLPKKNLVFKPTYSKIHSKVVDISGNFDSVMLNYIDVEEDNAKQNRQHNTSDFESSGVISTANASHANSIDTIIIEMMYKVDDNVQNSLHCLQFKKPEISKNPCYQFVDLDNFLNLYKSIKRSRASTIKQYKEKAEWYF